METITKAGHFSYNPDTDPLHNEFSDVSLKILSFYFAKLICLFIKNFPVCFEED